MKKKEQIKSAADTLAELSIDNRQKEIFEYLRDNLTIRIDADQHREDYYQAAGVSLNITLNLKNPETGKVEAISTDSGSFNV